MTEEMRERMRATNESLAGIALVSELADIPLRPLATYACRIVKHIKGSL